MNSTSTDWWGDSMQRITSARLCIRFFVLTRKFGCTFHRMWTTSVRRTTEINLWTKPSKKRWVISMWLSICCLYRSETARVMLLIARKMVRNPERNKQKVLFIAEKAKAKVEQRVPVEHHAEYKELLVGTVVVVPFVSIIIFPVAIRHQLVAHAVVEGTYVSRPTASKIISFALLTKTRC